MMKKLILTAAVAVLMMPAMASAQSSASGTLIATATVADYMEITGNTNLDFGTLSRTVDNVVDATTSTAQRTVAFNRDVDVTFENVPTALAGTVAGNTLSVQLECGWVMGGGTWTTAACSGATFSLNHASGVESATLGFGGTITAADAAAAAADSYSATMTIKVDARS